MQSKIKSDTSSMSIRGMLAFLCVAGVCVLLASATVVIAETKAEFMQRARAAAAAARVAADEATAAAAEARARADAAVGITAEDLLAVDPTPTPLPAEVVAAPVVEDAVADALEPVAELTVDDLLEVLPPAPVAATAY